jgi:hypothetical protein
MRQLGIFTALMAIIIGCEVAQASSRNLNDFLEQAKNQTVDKVKEIIADQDIDVGSEFANYDLANGINIASEYRYNIESSYISQYYSRIDKWNLNTNVEVGDVIEKYATLPFSFSINRESSIYFVRQFPTKSLAMKAFPYSPTRLPLTAALALKNLNAGDFVSMPANLNIAVSLNYEASYGNIATANLEAGISGILSGEFTIQVFKIDDTHVRLKLISQRSRSAEATLGVGLAFDIYGIDYVDEQIKKLVDTDLLDLGISLTPQSQFILDYVFDLKDKKAQEAYNQILSSSKKFKDILIMDPLSNAGELKDKLISSYDLADQLWMKDRKSHPSKRRIHRIFKGFSKSKENNKHMRVALIFASYEKEHTYSESKVSFIDKNEKNLDFFYPTFSKYTETELGENWFFNVKDQSSITNFGLIPRFNSEKNTAKNPDLGFTFERNDKFFSLDEQKDIEKFLINQLPPALLNEIDLSSWDNGQKKINSRIFLQLVLKSNGFKYLKKITNAEIKQRLLNYVKKVSNTELINGVQRTSSEMKLKNFLFLQNFIEQTKVVMLANKLYTILQEENGDAEDMTKKLVSLNQFGLFDKIGVGFLISLLPQEKLNKLVYLKLEMSAQDLEDINFESGKLNYSQLYDELTSIQSHMSNRSYDLRITDEDTSLEKVSVEDLKNQSI